jgi:hypothetical protein
MNKKKILLLVNNIQGLIDTIKLELDEEPEEVREQSRNAISVEDLVKRMHENTICEQFEGVEEESNGTDILLGGKEEMEFYERFNLGERE